MSFKLDTLLARTIIQGPETISDGYISDPLNIDNREAEFGIQINWESGAAPNLVVWIQVSLDRINYVDMVDSDQPIGTVSGTGVYDIAGTGVSSIRLRFEGTGSVDIINAIYLGKRRH